MIRRLFFALLVAFAFARAQAATSSAKLSTPKTKMKLSKSAPVDATNQAPLSLSPTLGITYSTLRGGTDPFTTTEDNGMSVGGLVDIQSPQNKDLFFQTGLLYNQMGAKLSDYNAPNGGGRLTGVRMNLTYLNVPAFVKFNFLRAQDNTFFVKAGLMPGVIVGKEFRASANGQTVSKMAIDDLKQYDVPALVGVGARIPFQKEYALMLDASWMRSLMTISGKENTYNQAFFITGGINIAL